MLRPPMFPLPAPGLSSYPLYGLRYSPEMLGSPLGLISPATASVMHERFKLEEEHRQREQRMREEEKEREQEKERARSRERERRAERHEAAAAAAAAAGHPPHRQESPGEAHGPGS
ncbi:UNVERIFIED_CONTAM: hypothetical protein B566_EDAN018752 [Ephemera danica]|nr:hypothetical protein B566_EDAN018752 [Ephemera danica]